MPVAKPGTGLERGLTSMASVLDKYMYGEQIKREREVAEREYAFRREQFDESTRRFDLNFEENVRQFDTSLSFQAEQSQLLRDHQTVMQDDRQAHTIIMQEDAQEFAHEEQALERTSRERHQEEQRKVEKYRISTQKRIADSDRRLRYKENKVARGRMFLGPYDKFSEMPLDVFIDANGNVYDPASIDILNELLAAAEGQSRIFADGFTPDQAASYLDAINKGAASDAEVVDQIIAAKLFRTQPNQYRVEGLNRLMLEEMGGDLAAFNALSPTERKKLENSVIHDLENMGPMQKKLDAEKISIQQQLLALETGISGYEGGAQGSAMGEIYDSYGQYFYVNNANIPVWNGVSGNDSGVGAHIGANSRSMLQTAVDISNARENGPLPGVSDEDHEKSIQSMVSQMKEYRDTMSTFIEQDGGDPAQANMFYNAALSISNGQAFDAEEFFLKGVGEGGPVAGKRKDELTSERRGGPSQTLSGGFIFKGQPGFEESEMKKPEREATRERQRAIQERITTAEQAEKATRELEEEEVIIGATQATDLYQERKAGMGEPVSKKGTDAFMRYAERKVEILQRQGRPLDEAAFNKIVDEYFRSPAQPTPTPTILIE